MGEFLKVFKYLYDCMMRYFPITLDKIQMLKIYFRNMLHI